MATTATAAAPPPPLDSSTADAADEGPSSWSDCYQEIRKTFMAGVAPCMGLASGMGCGVVGDDEEMLVNSEMDADSLIDLHLTRVAQAEEQELMVPPTIKVVHQTTTFENDTDNDDDDGPVRVDQVYGTASTIKGKHKHHVPPSAALESRQNTHRSQDDSLGYSVGSHPSSVAMTFRELPSFGTSWSGSGKSSYAVSSIHKNSKNNNGNNNNNSPYRKYRSTISANNNAAKDNNPAAETASSTLSYSTTGSSAFHMFQKAMGMTTAVMATAAKTKTTGGGSTGVGSVGGNSSERRPSSSESSEATTPFFMERHAVAPEEEGEEDPIRWSDRQWTTNTVEGESNSGDYVNNVPAHFVLLRPE